MNHSDAIIVTPSVYGDYKGTIGKHEPETVALLGGRLDQPNRITKYKFCPPGKVNGQRVSNSAMVMCDPEYMNWVIVNEWIPQGLYCLGLWHSHPGSISSPSGRGGDLGAFEEFLCTDAARKAGWDKVIAPITTFDRDGEDTIHGWTYRRGAQRAAPAPIVIDVNGTYHEPKEFERLLNNYDPAGVAPTGSSDGEDPDSPRIQRTFEAEELIIRLSRAHTRIKEEVTGSWWQRQRSMRMFGKYAKREMQDLLNFREREHPDE